MTVFPALLSATVKSQIIEQCAMWGLSSSFFQAAAILPPFAKEGNS